MIDIRVCRGSSIPGECNEDDELLNWGDISDSLLTTESAGLERGRVEIDRDYSNRNMVGLNLNTVEFKQPGIMVAIDEGIYRNGCLRGININYTISNDGISIGTTSSVERTL